MNDGRKLPWLQALLAALALATPSSGCLGPPYADLWTLVEEADHIVVAEVVAVEPSPVSRMLIGVSDASAKALPAVGRISSNGAFVLEEIVDGIDTAVDLTYVAELRILETLRGSLRGPKIRIRFGTWGAVAIPGERAVFFLRDGWWSLRFLDFGNSMLLSRDPKDLEDQKTAIRAAIDLQESGRGSSRMEWALAAAGLAGSRRHVIERLEYRGLSDEQKRALADSFVRVPTLESLPTLMTILEKTPHPAFDRRAAKLVAAAVASPGLSPYVSTGLIEPMLSRLGHFEPVWDASHCCDDESMLLLWDTLLAGASPSPGPGDFAEVRRFQASQERWIEKLRATYR